MAVEQVLFPQLHVLPFIDEPSVLTQVGFLVHLLNDARQYNPIAVEQVLVPQLHSLLFIDEPSLLLQTGIF